MKTLCDLQNIYKIGQLTSKLKHIIVCFVYSRRWETSACKAKIKS